MPNTEDKPTKLTPMMKQYNEAKRACPDALLLFRMGDFYELFHDDAKQAAATLNLALTSREKGPDAVPMAGFPHHQLETYLGKLIAAGLRAAVCEQVEDPKKAKGLVRREVTRILSPGTVTDPAELDERTNLYFASLYRAGSSLGIAYGDVSTGDFRVAEVPVDRAREELTLQFARFDPREILAAEGEEISDSLPPPRVPGQAIPLTRAPSWTFGEEAAVEALVEHFETAGLEGYGCAHMKA